MPDDVIYTDPEVLASKIDWEGWPDALEWFAEDRFEDHKLDELIYQAKETYYALESFRTQIEDRLEELGVTVNG